MRNEYLEIFEISNQILGILSGLEPEYVLPLLCATMEDACDMVGADIRDVAIAILEIHSKSESFE